MCGRYSLGDPSPLMRRFGLNEFAETRITPRFNVAPTELVPIIVETRHGRRLRLARWGFTPTWLDGPQKAPPSINARADTLAQRPLFRSAVRYHRCLVPADGFYEWKTEPGSKKKQPYFFRLRDGELFAFAGLYAPAHGDEPYEATFTIVTTDPNELVSELHDRMPAILTPETEQAWLERSETRSREVLPLIEPYPAWEMEAFPVSPRVNKAGEEGPDLIERFDEDTSDA